MECSLFPGYYHYRHRGTQRSSHSVQLLDSLDSLLAVGRLHTVRTSSSDAYCYTINLAEMP